MKRIFGKLIAIPKSFLICWKLFGIKKAFQLPMIVAVGFAVKAKKGQVTIDPKSRVLLGFETWMAPSRNSESSLQIDDGFIKFQGVARIWKVNEKLDTELREFKNCVFQSLLETCNQELNASFLYCNRSQCI